MPVTNPKIVLIGGGTGSFTLLQALKNWTINITAIVNMCDDGGSSGELRDELGVLPPGDIRQCLVALSNQLETRDLFSYRFGDGKFNGHPVGNIILSALELQLGSFSQAVKVVADFLQITGQVLPVSNDNHTLVMEDGSVVIKGENQITTHQIRHQDAKVYLNPLATLNPEAKQAIKLADMVVIAPGNVYGSLLPALSVIGMSEALASSKAKIVMVTNLINKPNQTYGWHVIDYVNKVEEYIGKGVIDVVLYNTKHPSKYLLTKYAEENELPVEAKPGEFTNLNLSAVGASLIAAQVYKQDPRDKRLLRTLIRHDAKAVVEQLVKIL